ncbi:MAG: hypothetical protein H0U95_09350 [Bacteroidetes bacterium]|nr:hypothetical protein [Bacteroidota bacterium]
MTRKTFINDSTYIVRVKLVRPQVKIDNRTIFFKGQRVSLSGIDAGVLLKEKLRITLGYYWLNNNLSAYQKTIEGVDYDRQLKMNYGSINTEFIYKNTRYFSLGMPLDFGFGNNELRYKNSITGEVQSKESGFVFLTDFGLSLAFKPIRWIGIKGIVGYRKTIFNQVKDFHFDGPFTSIGIYIDVREIIKDVKMFKLKKRYRKNTNQLGTAVDLITD